jgi:serine O-acetyltransferase
MGVVIGETCEIGDRVTIYQGVTLGGTGKERGKRHPTIGDDVMISAGAKILGPFKVGDRTRIGAGSVVLQEIPEDCTVVGIPGRIVRRAGLRVMPGDELDQMRLPDPVSMEFCKLRNKIEELEKIIKEKL